jgi:DNA-binding SARP family transcriptional activator
MTFRLNALGSLVVVRSEGPQTGPAVQRRTLALLAYLAEGRDRGIARDRDIGALWPDTTDDRARHALAQTLYRVRQSFGAEAVEGVDVLRLDPSTFSVDFIEFEDAVAADRLDDAIALYRGPFLDGFVLPGADEFERWAEEKRGQLAALRRRTLERSATNAERAGAHARAVDLWRTLVNADPLNSRVAARLVRALTAAGQRPAALQFARVHEALLRQELNAMPTGEFVDAVAAARPRSASQSAMPPVESTVAEAHVASPPVRQEPDQNAGFHHTTETLRVAIPRRKLRLAAMLGIGLLVGLVALAFAAARP